MCLTYVWTDTDGTARTMNDKLNFLAESITFEVDGAAGDPFEYQDGQPVRYKFAYIGRVRGILSNGSKLEIVLPPAATQIIMDSIAVVAQRVIDAHATG